MYKRYLGISLLLILNFSAFSGTMGTSPEFKPSLYFKVGSGGSYSMNSHIQFNDSNLNNWPANWMFANEGYNHDVGDTALYAAAIGYDYSPLLSFDIDYIYRPSFNYNVYQTPTPSTVAANNPPKERFFDLQSNSLMVNVYFHGKGLNDQLNWNTNYGFNVEPFIGGGLGVAFNTVSNFHSLSSGGNMMSYVPDMLRTSLAWQFSGGLNLYNDSHFNLGAGYRYYNGDKFSSNDYVVNTTNQSFAWKGIIQANEFFINLGYRIDA